MSLPFFPPAPADGPASLLSLPPDDWVLQPKMDGIRIIWFEGKPYTRQGTLLTEAKRAKLLTELLLGITSTLDGEWIPEEATYYAFDLPQHPGNLDQRLATLHDLKRTPGFELVDTVHQQFPEAYAALRVAGIEGVVLKRRDSLYPQMHRPSQPTRDWLKRRFIWDSTKG